MAVSLSSNNVCRIAISNGKGKDSLRLCLKRASTNDRPGTIECHLQYKRAMNQTDRNGRALTIKNKSWENKNRTREPHMNPSLSFVEYKPSSYSNFTTLVKHIIWTPESRHLGGAKLV